jgi:hypothetical protein
VYGTAVVMMGRRAGALVGDARGGGIIIVLHARVVNRARG